MTMLWRNIRDKVWDIELRDVIHLKDRAERDGFTSKQQQFYSEISTGTVCIKKFLIDTIRPRKGPDGGL